MSTILSFLLQVVASTCTPVYTPEVSHPPINNFFGVYSLSPYPVDFIPSGNDCAGPIPVWKVSFLNNYEEKEVLTLIKKMAPSLQKFSLETGFEVCARVCRTENESFIAQPVTIGSHVSCVASVKTCPKGTATEQTVHTHGSYPIFVVNRIDALGWNLPESEIGLAKYKGEMNDFSPEDIANTPLWLVPAEKEIFFLQDEFAEKLKFAL